MAGVTITPAVTPAAPAPAPAASLADAYDIGSEDIIDQEPATSVAPSVPGESESPSARPVPPKDPVTGQFVKKSHPKWLERQARDLGISDDEMGEMETDVLGEAVTATMRFAQEDKRARATEPREPVPPSEPGIDWGKDDSGRAMTEEDYAPAVASAVKSNHSLEKRVKQLEGIVQSLLQNEGRRAADSHFDKIDTAFMGLKDMTGIIGTGSRHDLERGSPEMKRRMAILREAQDLAGKDATEAAILRKLPEAAKSLFGTAATPAPAASTPPVAEIERWNNGATARPTHRDGAPEPKGRKAAEKAVAQILRERQGGGDEVQDEDFPG